MRKLKVNDFFCGCGGLGLAFQEAGYEIVGAWDFDKFAVKTYRENVGDHVQKADIKELHQEDIPRADVWAFGFPCQDLSVAGKQKGMILKCQDCGEVVEINPEEYTGENTCPKCSGKDLRAESRSGCFFEIMRLLEETEREREEAMPAVIIAENVRGLKPYLPVLCMEYERRGYTAHIQMFNSKYWGVPQSRERYAVIGTRNKLGLSFKFPEEQHEFIPKLSDFLEKDVPEKYYLSDEKAQTIIQQALKTLGFKEWKAKNDVVTAIAEETGLLNPEKCGKTLRVGGGGSLSKKHNYQYLIVDTGENCAEPQIFTVTNTHPSGHGMNGNVYHSEGLAPTLTTNKGEGIKVLVEERKG